MSLQYKTISLTKWSLKMDKRIVEVRTCSFQNNPLFRLLYFLQWKQVTKFWHPLKFRHVCSTTVPIICEYLQCTLSMRHSVNCFSSLYRWALFLVLILRMRTHTHSEMFYFLWFLLYKWRCNVSCTYPVMGKIILLPILFS